MPALARFNGSWKTSRNGTYCSQLRRQSGLLSSEPRISRISRDVGLGKEDSWRLRVFSILRSALQPLSKRIVVAFVYGRWHGNKKRRRATSIYWSLERPHWTKYCRGSLQPRKVSATLINPTVYSVAEFKAKLANGNHFLTAVLKRQKVFLRGDEDELRKMGGVRLAEAGADRPR
jgi:hypothetical protein